MGIYFFGMDPGYRVLGVFWGAGVRDLKFSTQAVILARNLKSEPVSRSNNPVGPLL